MIHRQRKNCNRNGALNGYLKTRSHGTATNSSQSQSFPSEGPIFGRRGWAGGTDQI